MGNVAMPRFGIVLKFHEAPDVDCGTVIQSKSGIPRRNNFFLQIRRIKLVNGVKAAEKDGFPRFPIAPSPVAHHHRGS